MLGDSVLTPDGQRFNEILLLQATMRFLRQLQIREADRYRVRVMSSAQGGVRVGLTSQLVSPEATAMTVLAGSEFLRSLDRLSAPEVSTGAGGQR